MMQRSSIGAWLLACALFAGAARAQDSRAELARRDLIARAEDARRAGHFDEALENATRAAQIRVTPSLRLLVAQAHGALGHVLEALDQARACVREAEAEATLRNRELVMSGCQEVVTRMEPRVGRLTVRVAPVVPSGLRVRVGDVELSSALVGVPVPVLPGILVVEATAPDHVGSRREVTVDAGSTGEVVLELSAQPEVASTPSPAVTPPSSAPVAPSTGTPRRSPLRALGWIGVGSAALSVGLGAVALGLRAGRAASFNRDCDAGVAYDMLSTDCRAHFDAGDTMSTMATGAFIAGGALAVAGVVMLVIAPTDRTPRHGGASWSCGVLAVGSGVVCGARC